MGLPRDGESTTVHAEAVPMALQGARTDPKMRGPQGRDLLRQDGYAANSAVDGRIHLERR